MEHADPDDKPEAPKQINWYSGWRLFAMAAAMVLGVKLIGILGAVVAVLVFHWLSRKRSAGVAATGAIAAGVLTAVVYSAALLPALYPQQAQPAAQTAPEQTPQTDRFGGVLAEPSISPNNPFSDPNYGKELLQKQ